MLTPALAYADDSETFFAQGRKLRSAGKCADAIVAFRRAFEIKPEGLGSLRNVAECDEELGRFASARSDWWNLRRSALQSNEPKYSGWDKDAEAAYARLESKVARITIRLVGYQPDKASVSIDGKPLDPRLLGVELERDLGPYAIEVSYGAATPMIERRTLLAGAREVVTLTVPEPKPGEVDGRDDSRGGRGLRNGGIAALAIGGAGFIGMAIAIGVRQSALSAFSSCAPSYTNCPPSAMGSESQGQAASTAVTALAVIGGLGVAIGVPLVIVGSRRKDVAPTTAFSIAPTLGGAGLQAGGRF